MCPYSLLNVRDWFISLPTNLSYNYNHTLGSALSDMIADIPIQNGEYIEVGRAVRRRMKQLGGGNIMKGIAQIETDVDIVTEMTILLNIDEQALKKELQFFESSQAQEAASSTESEDTKAIYEWYTKDDKDGNMDMRAMKRVVSDLGILEGLKPNEIDSFYVHKIDPFLGNEGRLDYEGFKKFYASLNKSATREQLRKITTIKMEDDLHRVFLHFCTNGNHSLQGIRTLDNAGFVKLCKQCNLVGRQHHITTTDIDLIFTKVKQKGQRRINFDQFLCALTNIAEKRNQELLKVVQQIVSAEDKLVQQGKENEQQVLKERSSTVPQSSRSHAKRPYQNRPQTAIGNRTAHNRSNMVMETDENQVPNISIDDKVRQQLKQVFIRFSTFGKAHSAPKTTEMDNVRFIKLVKDTGLLDNKFNTTKADLVFTKLMNKTTKKLDFTGFVQSLHNIAQEKKIDAENIQNQVLKSNGPNLSNTTIASFVRLHDDKSSYTGVHAKGGPTTVDKKVTLETLVDRQAAEHKQRKNSLTSSDNQGL